MYVNTYTHVCMWTDTKMCEYVISVNGQGGLHPYVSTPSCNFLTPLWGMNEKMNKFSLNLSLSLS